MKLKPVFALHFAVISTLGGVWAAPQKAAAVPADPQPVAIYASDPSHLWNRLHGAFFVRPDTKNEVPNADAVDPPLWFDTSGFLKSGPSHRLALAVLDEFLADDSQALMSEPLKRAVLQQDLWSVFDWSATSKAGDGVSNENLRSRLASAIGRLALTTEEIASLPNNFSDAAAAGAFSANYDPEHPRKPFLPTDLFDPDGSWVCVRGALPGPSAPVHVEYYKGRSPFLVFIRLPGGRAATLKYVDDLNTATSGLTKPDPNAEALPQFPVGTMVALVRQMAVINAAGEIQMTPLTQTVQMRVYRQVGHDLKNHKNSQTAVKFRLSRGSLFAGRHGGLEPISWEEPMRVSLLQPVDIYDRKSGQNTMTVMQSCLACHSCGGATVHSVFTYKQDDWVPAANLLGASQLRLTVTDMATESKRTRDWKLARSDWGMLKDLLSRHISSAP